MPALNADILYLFFNSANMNRWNDHMRPVDLTELDKQSHKAAIAWVLGKFEESAGNPMDWNLIIEHTMFSFIQRSVLTDLKPQVFHRITSERRGPVNDYVLSEFDRLVPGSDPAFRERFSTYLDDPKSEVGVQPDLRFQPLPVRHRQDPCGDRRADRPPHGFGRGAQAGVV